VKASVSGTLKDQATGNPIVHGHISFIPLSGWHVENPTSDSSGKFSTHLFPGSYIIYAKADGYTADIMIT